MSECSFKICFPCLALATIRSLESGIQALEEGSNAKFLIAHPHGYRMINKIWIPLNILPEYDLLKATLTLWYLLCRSLDGRTWTCL